jgi:hypothetical protein
MTKVNVAGIDISKKFFDVFLVEGDEHRQKQFSNDATVLRLQHNG